jgi:hypothetical protein
MPSYRRAITYPVFRPLQLTRLSSTPRQSRRNWLLHYYIALVALSLNDTVDDSSSYNASRLSTQSGEARSGR